MAKKLPKRTVVIVGGGLCAGLVSRQLTAKGIDVLVLERGGDHAGAAEATLPNQRDELRWDRRQGLMQNWQRETYTLRHSREEESLPIRWMEAFLPGEGVGGAASHWNGCAWRWSEYDPTLRTRYESRYGKAAIPADMPLQDWGTTYGELEPYHDLFEKLFGLSGKAGNIKGAIQPGGNPFEAPRRDEYPQKPLEMGEADVIFKAAAEALGLRPFPQPAANSPGVTSIPMVSGSANASTAATASGSSARRMRRPPPIPCCTPCFASGPGSRSEHAPRYSTSTTTAARSARWACGTSILTRVRNTSSRRTSWWQPLSP